MEVSAEAKRIMVQALGKLYSSRSQRGGLRLHRSLLLTLVMRSARDIYHAAQATVESAALDPVQPESQAEETMDTTGGRLETEASPSPPTIQPQENGVVYTEQTDAHPLRCRRPTGRGDKENRDMSRPDRLARKRRGKTAVEPDFLPCKKAKMEPAKEKRLALNTVLRSSPGNCCRIGGDTLASIPVSRAVAAF